MAGSEFPSAKNETDNGSRRGRWGFVSSDAEQRHHAQVLKLRKYQLAAQASEFPRCSVMVGVHSAADCRIHSRVLKLRPYQLAAQASEFLRCLVLYGVHSAADCRIHSQVLKLRKYQLAAQASEFLRCSVMVGVHSAADCRIHSRVELVFSRPNYVGNPISRNFKTRERVKVRMEMRA